VQFVEALRDKE